MRRRIGIKDVDLHQRICSVATQPPEPAMPQAAHPNVMTGWLALGPCRDDYSVLHKHARGLECMVERLTQGKKKYQWEKDRIVELSK